MHPCIYSAHAVHMQCISTCRAYAVHVESTCPMRFIARNTQEHSLMMTRPMTPKIPAIVGIPIVGIAIAGIAADHCMHT